MGLSKLSKTCSKCIFVDTCDHKQMEAYGYLNPQMLLSASTTVIENGLSPAGRETKEIFVAGVKRTVYVDDIQKELYKALYHGFLQNGG